MGGDETTPQPGPRASPAVWAVLALVLGGIVGFSVWRSGRARDDAEPPGELLVDDAGDEIAGAGPEGPETGVLARSPGSLPDVPATERSGRAMRTAELRGSWNAVSFLFTSCGNTCPRLARELKTLHDAAPDGLRLVTFTVDPGTDTPETLARYAEGLGADAARWLFLRTTAVDVQTVAREIRANNDPEKPILHSNDLFVLDPAGRLVALYHPLDDPRWLATLRADLPKLRAGNARK